MDGPAFHRSDRLMKYIKKRNLLFQMDIQKQSITKQNTLNLSQLNNKKDNLDKDIFSDFILGNSIIGLINMVLFFKNDWTEKQMKVANLYEKYDNQEKVSRELNVSRPTITESLKSSNFKQVKYIEKNLNYTLKTLSKILK